VGLQELVRRVHQDYSERIFNLPSKLPLSDSAIALVSKAATVDATWVNLSLKEISATQISEKALYDQMVTLQCLHSYVPVLICHFPLSQ
jgi:hypothetical protein